MPKDVISDLLTQGIARMSGLGAEPKADRFGFALVAPNRRRLAVFTLPRQKNGQVLVRTSAREKISHFKGKDRLCQEL